MSLSFKIKSVLRRRRWRKYWTERDAINHVEFYRRLAAEFRERPSQ